MSVGEAEAPKEMSKLRNFGASARAASLPAPPARPLVVAGPEPMQDAGGADATVPEVPAPAAWVDVPVEREPAPSVPLPEDLLGSLVASPRTAVVSTDPARRLSPKRQIGTYLADDALRTLQYMTYVEGCELWRLLDTAVRALAQARGVEVRPYTDEEIGKR
jgi:hypothetical protein